jgi:hypothetical protein
MCDNPRVKMSLNMFFDMMNRISCLRKMTFPGDILYPACPSKARRRVHPVHPVQSPSFGCGLSRGVRCIPTPQPTNRVKFTHPRSSPVKPGRALPPTSHTLNSSNRTPFQFFSHPVHPAHPVPPVSTRPASLGGQAQSRLVKPGRKKSAKTSLTTTTLCCYQIRRLHYVAVDDTYALSKVRQSRRQGH